jgi:hypothetical protein
MFVCRGLLPAYFRGEVLNRDTPTRVPEDIGMPVGLFGVEPFDSDASQAAGAPAPTPASDEPAGTA